MALALLALASCSQATPPSPILDAGKLASVVVGRSSRTDVFAALGRPGRTEQSLLGETWIYQSRDGDAGSQRFMSGAAAATGVVGAFVPYFGLVGSGLGLANAARREPDVVSVAVSFNSDGVVRDCIYSSTALPAGVQGLGDDSARIVGCQKLPPPAA